MTAPVRPEGQDPPRRVVVHRRQPDTGPGIDGPEATEGSDAGGTEQQFEQQFNHLLEQRTMMHPKDGSPDYQADDNARFRQDALDGRGQFLAARRSSLTRQGDTIGSSGARDEDEMIRARADLEHTTRGVEHEIAARDVAKRGRGAPAPWPWDADGEPGGVIQRTVREGEMRDERERRTVRLRKKQS